MTKISGFACVGTPASRRWLLALLAWLVLCTQLASQAFGDDTVTVDMGSLSGAPTYRASGFIYGISQDGSQPPNALLTDIKITHLRCGGAQIGCPKGGYVNGQYAARWSAVKAYYAKAKAIGATLLVLVHDIWGADGSCSVPNYPGDGGDWTAYTTFIDQLITDFKAAGMTGKDVRWELWNEPDYSGFWKGSQAQWLEMWKRGYQQVRAALPDAVIEGPSTAGGVGGWFTAFLDYAKTNNVVPDYIGWHEAGGGDPVNDAKSARSALSSRGINVTNLDVSEYGSTGDQTAGHSAWYLARFERAGLDGLRSNWGGGNGLYATLGGMVTNSWQPKGQYWIYKRYADQTGLQAAVTAGAQADAVAYLDAAARRSIIVVGNKGGVTGTVSVKITNIPADLQAAGTAQVQIENMPDGTAAVTAPTVVSNSSMPFTANALTVPLTWTKAADGYAITLAFGSQDGGVPDKDGGVDAVMDGKGTDAAAGGTSGSAGAGGLGASDGTGGAAGAPGAPATGGVTSTGGSTGTGGMRLDAGSASGGTSGPTSGSGGAAAGSGGATSSGGVQGSGGTSAPAASAGEGSGCSCSTGSAAGQSSTAAFLLLLFGMGATARRRGRRSPDWSPPASPDPDFDSGGPTRPREH